MTVTTKDIVSSRKGRSRWIVGIGILVALVVLVAGCGVLALRLAQNETFPQLAGDPEVGTWYGIYPEGAQSALGEPYHATFKLGSSNNVMVLFNGGGVSINAEMASNPDGRYFNTNTGGDVLSRLSLGGNIFGSSPFADWTVISLPYTTGDFHIGAGDFTFTDAEGVTRTIHHVGYLNFDLVMNEVRRHVGTPNRLLISGYSAGGWGAALMADHVMSYFPETRDVTVVVDSALLLNDNWRQIATDVWRAPPEISNRMRTDNLTLDALSALAADHPDVKVLFSSSTRDESLVEVQAYFDSGVMAKTSAGGDAYTRRLSNFVTELRRAVPRTAFYIFEGRPTPEGLSSHTMLLLTSFSEDIGEITPAQWISNAVNGDLEDYGLDLLR